MIPFFNKTISSEEFKRKIQASCKREFPQWGLSKIPTQQTWYKKSSPFLPIAGINFNPTDEAVTLDVFIGYHLESKIGQNEPSPILPSRVHMDFGFHLSLHSADSKAGFLKNDLKTLFSFLDQHKKLFSKLPTPNDALAFLEQEDKTLDYKSGPEHSLRRNQIKATLLLHLKQKEKALEVLSSLTTHPFYADKEGLEPIINQNLVEIESWPLHV